MFDDAPADPSRESCEASDYRLAPGVTGRLIGALLVLLAAVLGATTLVVAVLGLPAWVLVAVAAAGLAGVLVVTYVLARRLVVVHLGSTGYRVRLVRGAGVHEASWREVERAVATTRRGVPVVELRLTRDRSTVIPVSVLAVDRDLFVRDLRRHLQRGQGLRPLS